MILLCNDITIFLLCLLHFSCDVDVLCMFMKFTPQFFGRIGLEKDFIDVVCTVRKIPS